jgi:Ca2+-binding RTX toxin-like protein
MFQFLKIVFRTKQLPSRRCVIAPERPTLRPTLDVLEGRDLMAAGISACGAVVTIEGAAVADRAEVNPLVPGWVHITLDAPAGGVVEFAQACPTAGLTLVYRGLGGNDAFVNNTAVNSMAQGGDGHDTLVGGSGTDVLDGGNGKDQLDGRIGNDTLSGGADEDVLRGGYGDDLLKGGDDRDYLYGDWGRDSLYGEAGDDYLHGGIDGIQDILWGGTGADTFIGEWIPSDNAFNIPGNRDFPQDADGWQGDVIRSE